MKINKAIKELKDLKKTIFDLKIIMNIDVEFSIVEDEIWYD